MEPDAARAAGINLTVRLFGKADTAEAFFPPGPPNARLTNQKDKVMTSILTNTAAMTQYRSVSDTSSATSAPTTAPTTEGGAIQATTSQSTRPSRACFRPPAPAAAAEIAMLVPAAARGLPEAITMRGNLSVPSTSPSIDPK